MGISAGVRGEHRQHLLTQRLIISAVGSHEVKTFGERFSERCLKNLAQTRKAFRVERPEPGGGV